MDKTNASECVVINATELQKMIEKLEKEYQKELKQPNDIMCTLTKGMIGAYKDVLSKSTPLIPIIENAFMEGSVFKENYKKEIALSNSNITLIEPDFDKYISNLKLDI